MDEIRGHVETLHIHHVNTNEHEIKAVHDDVVITIRREETAYKKYLYKRMIRDLNNRRFGRKLLKNLKSHKNLILESISPQGGKTKVQLIMAWILLFCLGKYPFFVLQNSLQDIQQFLNRVSQFNKKIDRWTREGGYGPSSVFHLTCVEVPPNKKNMSEYTLGKHIENLHPLILTLHPKRYGRVEEIIEKAVNRPIVAIFDESDLSVGSVLPETTVEKENIYRQHLQPHRNIQKVFISSTNFAVLNSPERTGDKFNYQVIPNNLYEHEGLFYRDFFTCSHFFDVPYIKDLRALESGSEKALSSLEDFFRDLEDIVTNPISPNQPNIALMNFDNHNQAKEVLGRAIVDRMGDRLIVSLYIETGVKEISRDRTRYYHEHIGNYLQRLKDQGNTLPIIIIATNKANRAITFRPNDHSQKLTHFFMCFSDTIHMEALMQAQRANGQYALDDPPTYYYLSKAVFQQIKDNYQNKQVLMSNIEIYHQTRSSREIISHTPLLKVSNKLSRKGVDDTRFMMSSVKCHGVYETIDEALGYARLFIQREHQYPFLIATQFVTFPINDFPYLKEDMNDSDEPYKNLSSSTKNKLNTDIKKKCREMGLKADTCQIGYTHQRNGKLNQLELHKEPNFRADLIALDSHNREEVPVVSYQCHTFPLNHIIIWHTTKGEVCLYINDDLEHPLWTSLSRE